MEEEKQNVKNEPPPETLTQKALGYADRLARVMFGLTGDWGKRSDIVRNNFDLGLACLGRGQNSDAVLRFRIVTWLEPQNVEAWYYLGCSYMSYRKRAAAQKAFAKALQLRPEYEEAAYMMALSGGSVVTPAHIPLPLMQAHFDDLAANYTQEQKKYGYQAPTLLASALRACLVPGRIDHTILELGVGTGLSGPLLRDIAAELTGVDMSEPMLVQARELKDEHGHKIYDSLILRDAQSFLKETPDESYDIVFASGLVSYMGDLQELFWQVAHVLKKGGLFAFNATITEGEGFVLDTKNSWYNYSAPYLRDLAAHNHLAEVVFTEQPVFPDWPMFICIFQK